MLSGPDDDLKELKKENEEKRKKIVALENREVDFKHYTQMNDLIITGLDMKLRTYARVAEATNGVPT